MVKSTTKTRTSTLALRLKRFGLKHSVISFIVFFFIVVAIYSLIYTLVDFRNLKVLNKDLRRLEAVLRENGFEEAKLTTECWHTQGKFGTGARVCEASVIITEILDKGEEAKEKVTFINDRLSGFFNTINKTGNFKPIDVGDIAIYAQGEGLSHASKYMPHIKTGRSCGGATEYDRKDDKVIFRFSCTTTPWIREKLRF